MTTEKARTYAASEDRTSSGPLSKNRLAKFSIIRSICCASPGSRKVVNISRNASSSRRPRKSNNLTNASKVSELDGLAMYSPTIRFDTRDDFFRNRATDTGLRSLSRIPCSARYSSPSLADELNFEAPWIMICFLARRARTLAGFMCSDHPWSSCYISDNSKEMYVRNVKTISHVADIRQQRVETERRNI